MEDLRKAVLLIIFALALLFFILISAMTVFILILFDVIASCFVWKIISVTGIIAISMFFGAFVKSITDTEE